MAVLAADIQAFTPLAAVTTARCQVHLDAALLEVDATEWGSLYDRGVLYLAAHMTYLFEVAGATPPGGPVQSESLGDASVSYAVAQMNDSDLSRTAWGSEFRRLRNIVGLSPTVTTAESRGFEVEPDEDEEDGFA